MLAMFLSNRSSRCFQADYGGKAKGKRENKDDDHEVDDHQSVIIMMMGTRGEGADGMLKPDTSDPLS